MADALLAKEHLDEAVDLLSLTTVLAVFYTLVFMLYCLCFWLSYAQFRDDLGKIKRQTVCTLVLATALLICATLNVIACNRIAQVIYIDNSTLPGGPFGLPAALSVATVSKFNVIVNMIETLLILGVLLWRVSVVWSGTRFAIPLTAVSSFFYLASAGLMIAYNAITWNIDNTSLTATPRVDTTMLIMSSVFSLASLLFMSSAIIARLLFIRRRHIKLMGKSDVADQYLGIAAMFIESYALDTLWGIGILISSGLKYAPTANLFNSCVIQVDILTNFLLIYRVFSGRAWTKQTQDRLSTLRWASNGAGMTNSGTVDLQQTNVSEEDPPVISSRNDV